jgi:hypothetical protein
MLHNASQEQHQMFTLIIESAAYNKSKAKMLRKVFRKSGKIPIQNSTGKSGNSHHSFDRQPFHWYYNP